MRDRDCRNFTSVTCATRGICIYYTHPHCTYTKDDTRSHDKQGQMARTSLKRLRPSAQLELAYRVRSLRHRAIFGSVAIAPRSPFDRTPPRRSSRSHIHRRRWRRRLTARRRASSGSSRSLVGRASRGRRGHARHPLGAHAPRARASASPGTADGRSPGSAQTPCCQLPGSRLSSLEGKPRRHRGAPPAVTSSPSSPYISTNASSDNRPGTPRTRRLPSHTHEAHFHVA